MTSQPTIAGASFLQLIESVQRIADEITASHAADVDAQARFPTETLAALKQAGVLSAPVPRSLGGAGCSMVELGQLCSTLSQVCGSSGMVLAMHYIQVACLVRHAMDRAFFRSYLAELVQHQYLLASITSEVGTYGDTRSSLCAVERDGDQFVLNKDATTGSYCAQADAILVTARRNQQANANDQVLVLVRRENCKLKQTTSWDTLGMRGTCSPGFRLESSGPECQIVPGSFSDSAAQSMVPYSHTLWSALWCGIAADAVARAAHFVRRQARQNPGVIPPTAMLLAEVSAKLQAMKHNWLTVAQSFDQLAPGAASMDALQTIGWALKFNNLKIASSEAAVGIVHAALQIVGMMGYKNDSPFSLGRHYRDALSASLMISNERIAAKSASMLLVFKDAP